MILLHLGDGQWLWALPCSSLKIEQINQLGLIPNICLTKSQMPEKQQILKVLG